MSLTLPFEMERVDPTLSDPKLPQLPLPTATSVCSSASSFQWPPSTYPLTQHVAWETIPWTLSRHQKHVLDQKFSPQIRFLGHVATCNAEMAPQRCIVYTNCFPIQNYFQSA